MSGLNISGIPHISMLVSPKQLSSRAVLKTYDSINEEVNYSKSPKEPLAIDILSSLDKNCSNLPISPSNMKQGEYLLVGDKVFSFYMNVKRASIRNSDRSMI